MKTYYVERYNIATTNHYVVCVWEASGLAGPHGSVTSASHLERHIHPSTIEAGVKWIGRLGTNRLPLDIDAIPAGPERFAKVGAYHYALWQKAYGIIRTVFPDLNGREDMGEISFTCGEKLPNKIYKVEIPDETVPA